MRCVGQWDEEREREKEGAIYAHSTRKFVGEVGEFGLILPRNAALAAVAFIRALKVETMREMLRCVLRF